jgi:predicted O-methyltransferase YrrM
MITKPRSIVTAYIHPGTIFQEFSECLLCMTLRESLKDQRILQNISVSHAYIATSRNEAVKLFLKTNAEWLLFFDYDMVFNPDFLEQLAEVADEEHKIVSGLYFNYLRDENLHPIWLIKNKKGEFCTIGSIPPNALVEVESVGMGGTLIHRSIFEKMAEVYKNEPFTWFGHDMGSEDGIPIRLGEDTTFCKRAKDLGFRLFGYSKAQMGHIKTRTITLETALEENKRNRKDIYGKEYFNSLAELTRKFNPKYGLEIGTEFGTSTEAFLSSSNMKLITIDPQDFKLDDLKAKYGDRVIFIHGFTPEAFSSIKHRKFDWIYIDGDHSYEAVKSDLENSWALLLEKGVIVIDDYGIEREDIGVKQAVDEFISKNNLKIYPVEDNPHKAVYLTKP